MQQLLSIFTFYRPYVIWSFVVNIVIAMVNPFVIPAIITKLLLTILVWFLINETNAKRKLMFYKNLGISTLKLFSIVFLIDITITIIFLIVVKEFI